MKRPARTLIALLCASALGAIEPVWAQTPGLSSDDLARRTIERRAIEAVIWGMPAVNYDLMLQEMLSKTGGKVDQVIYWGRPLDSKNQTLTPNPDALYFMAFYNTKDGPIVLDLPPGDKNGSFNGNIVNAWQMPLEDAGLLGYDKGAGGKYLILPPGYTGPKPAGYIPLQSDTFGGYALIRANLKSHGDEDVAKSIAYGKRMKVYPLTQAASPAPTVFTDVKDVVFDSTIRYDASFFTNLDRIVQSESWLPRDRAMIDQLKSLGIEKGKPFAPGEATNALLAKAAREAGAWLEARYDAGLPPFFSPTSRWTFPAPPDIVKVMQDAYADPNIYPVDDRGMVYSYAFIGIKRLGAGQFYLISIRDKDGEAFDGANTYRLTVPPNPPVEQYWSVTAYDRQTHTLIKNMPRASRSSQIPDLQKNADGSIDIYFGPTAPAGMEANWVPTDPNRKFDLMFRFYAPTKALFDKAWTLSDVERIGPSRTAQSEAPSPVGDAVPVTTDNFIRAESDLYFGGVVKDAGGVGKFFHNREPTPLDKQIVIRMNRDTLYSGALFDLDAGPVTITLPDAGKRFMSMQVISEDHYTPAVIYAAGNHTLSKEQIGTRYVVTAIRTLVDPNDPKDVEQVHALQDAIKVSQASPGRFEVPNWDQASQRKVRDALLALGSTLPDSKRMFGAKGQVDPVRRLVGAATAWGGNPEKEATYLNVTPSRNDGASIHRLSVKDVPVDGFWSISVYSAEGYFQKNPYDAYTLNNITAKQSADGSVAIQFGGCDGKIANCLPTPPGWNYLVRLYRPRAEVLSGTWKFPEAQPGGVGTRALK
jgi:hypothetical protein